jgi:hypothetical protein
MNRTVQEWAKVSAEAVTAGSVAQATNVLQMALEDIATLAGSDAAVARIWKALGIETYEQAGGKEISEIVASKCEALAVLKARMTAAHDTFGFDGGDLRDWMSLIDAA